MGNRILSVIQTLRDPKLVRTVQEKCGVKEIVLEPNQTPDDAVRRRSLVSSSASSDEDEPVKSAPDNSQRHKLRSSSPSIPEWLSSGGRVRRKVRTPPPSCDESDYEVTEDYNFMQYKEGRAEVLVVETNSFFDTFFRLATEVGYEPFYITILPLIFWNVDTVLGRHMVTIWGMSMYVGQASKQIFRIRRPASPPAIRLEDNPSIETEYGFPSTHATVATAIPFSLLYSCYVRYVMSLWVGLGVVLFWCISVSFSRIYLGVHSVLDVLVGILIAIVMFPIYILTLIVAENWIFIYDYTITGPFLICLVIFLLYIYPVDSKQWSKDRGDTGAIIGAAMGVLLGQWAMGKFPDDLAQPPFVPYLPSIHMLSLGMVRYVVGLSLLLPTRFIMKIICFKLLPVVMPTHGVKEVFKRPLVELPYKIITYGTIGFNAAYLSPMVFEICGISRWDQSVFN